MIPSVLFCPFLAGFIVASPATAPNEFDNASAELVVLNKEDPEIPAEGDQLERLRGHLRSLSDSLEQTQKAVNSVARQRDEAREESRLGQKMLGEAGKKLESLQGKLEKAQAEASRWKEKAQTAEMTQADMEKFRGDLKGAMADFEHLKGDFAKARTELSDPIARAEMKKAMAGVKKEHQNLKRDIEIAIKARNESQAETAKVRKELEQSQQVAKRLQVELEERKTENAGIKERLAEAMAFNDSHKVKFAASQARVAEAEKKMAALQREKEAAVKNLASMEKRGVMTAEMEARKKEAEGRLAGMNAQLKAVEQECGALKARSEEMSARLKEREAELALVRVDLKDRDTALAEELKSTKIELARSQSELGFLQKSKSQMERKLVEQGSEIRQLKGALRKVEEEKIPEGVKVEREADHALGAHPIPRAIIIYEG